MKNDSVRRVHIKIKSKSHPEGSKKQIEKVANELGLLGYAQHTENRLEIVAQGERKSVWEFVKKCTNGNRKIKEVLFYFKEPRSDFQNFRLI
ncbi:acylphosphatase [candidate division WWE3 bacterium]|nr:acylphosphatase [candidate division WWE3 bacterium]